MENSTKEIKKETDMEKQMLDRLEKDIKDQSPFLGKVKKEYTDTTTFSADLIIPISQGGGKYWTEISQTISRSGCFPIDAIYESMREGYKHFTHIVTNDEDIDCSYKEFLLALKDKETQFKLLTGEKHPENLTYKEMFERYPNNFWTVDPDQTHINKNVFRGKDNDLVIFCNVDYSTVKVTSKVTNTEDVQVYPFLEDLKYKDGFRLSREHPHYFSHTSSPIQFPHSSHLLD